MCQCAYMNLEKSENHPGIPRLTLYLVNVTAVHVHSIK